MLRRRVSLCALALLSVSIFASSAASAQTSGVSIRKVDTDAFPNVTVTISLAEAAQLTADQVKVTEDRKAVQGMEIQSLSTSQGIDVVLAIDTSGSMRGEPLTSAIDAAKRFLQTSPKEVRIGLLTFSDTVQIVRKPSTDRAAALKALDSLAATGETSLYDAVVGASGMFSGPEQRNIILLSDGGDTTSSATLRSAGRAAKDANATIFSIGLTTPETDVGALKRLSSTTDGRYSPAASADLAAVYENLAKEIANQYLISYRSASAGGTNVSIRVTIGTATDTSLVLTPRQSIPPPKVGPTPTPAPPLLRGSSGLAIALILCFVAIFVALVMFTAPAARSRRDRELAKRVSAVPTSDPLTKSETENIVAAYAPSLAAAGKRLAEATGITASLEQRLERGGIPLSPGEFLAACGLGILVGGVAGLIFLQDAFFMLVFAVLGAASPLIYLTIATKRRMKRLHGQLPDILMILASSIRAGHSFLQALDTVSKEVAEPGGKEFARVLAEIRLGRPLDETMNAMADRIGSVDFKWAVLAVNIQREVGGNLAEVLDTVAETVREREYIRRQINVLSAEGKLSMYILIGLPLMIGLYMFKVNRDYIGLLFKTHIGMIMMGTSLSLLVLGIFWMRKIVKIDV